MTRRPGEFRHKCETCGFELIGYPEGPHDDPETKRQCECRGWEIWYDPDAVKPDRWDGHDQV